jgi:Pectate lyase superfamily protein/Chaperone of endosialidase
MLRREFPKALLASAAGVALAPQRAQAQTGNAPFFERTAAEITAGAMPVDRSYPPLNVWRYGTNAAPGVTDMTEALRAALSVASVSGGVVYAPAQSYKITAALIVPPGVTLCGDGPYSTTLEHHVDSAGAIAVTLGNSDTHTSYGCALRNLAIQMHVANTTAMMLRATIGAWVENVQLLGDGHTFSYTGCVIRGGSTVGCFFNVLQNVYAEHFNIGFQFNDLGTLATNQTFINCSAFGDFNYGDRTSCGVQFDAAAHPNSGFSGESSIWLGGDFENCATGVSLSARTEYTQWFGTRFESNGTDVDFGTNTTGTARNAFYGPTNSFKFAGSLRPDNAYYLGPYCCGVHISRGAGGLGTNIAIGNSALTLGKISTGSDNVALGVGALAAQQTGRHCVAVGSAALAAATASDNTAVGESAGASISTGAQNTLHGASSGSWLTSGSDNTAVGHNAQCGTNGDGNLAIGSNAGTPSGPHTLSGSHQAVFGDARLANAYIQVPWTTVADRRDVADVAPLASCLDVVCALRPVSFRMDDRSRHDRGARAGAREVAPQRAGLVAQDVESALREQGLDPGLVVDVSDPDKLGLTYARLLPFLAGAIRDLTLQVRSLKGELDTLHQRDKQGA